MVGLEMPLPASAAEPSRRRRGDFNRRLHARVAAAAADDSQPPPPSSTIVNVLSSSSSSTSTSASASSSSTSSSSISSGSRSSSSTTATTTTSSASHAATTTSTPSKNPGGTGPGTTVIVAITVVSVLFLIGVVFFAIHRYRLRRNPRNIHASQKPTRRKPRQWLSSLLSPNQGRYEAASSSGDERLESQQEMTGGGSSTTVNSAVQSSMTSTSTAAATTTTTTGGVDRNTSIRSIMTLPAYRSMAAPNEQVLGREGERDGVDTILDLPTLEQEESLRDEEMEALYQVRQARRVQIAERDQRRRDRDAAIARNDGQALVDIRARTLAARENTELTDLRQNVDRIRQDRRNRSLSTVSYGDLGVVRHDGSRVRANSQESERVGLLDDAASIAHRVSTDLPPSGSWTSLGLGHTRGRSSVASLVSMDNNTNSMSPPTAGASVASLALSRTYSRTSHVRRPSTAAGSSPELVEHHHTEDDPTALPPPEYEDIPLDSDQVPHSTSSTSLTSILPSSRTHAAAVVETRIDPPPDYTGPSSYRAGSRDSWHGSSSPSSSSLPSPSIEQSGRQSTGTTREDTGAARQSTRPPTLEIVPSIVVNEPSPLEPVHPRNTTP